LIHRFAAQSITCWFNLEKPQVQGTAALQSQSHRKEGRTTPCRAPHRCCRTADGLKSASFKVCVAVSATECGQTNAIAQGTADTASTAAVPGRTFLLVWGHSRTRFSPDPSSFLEWFPATGEIRAPASLYLHFAWGRSTPLWGSRGDPPPPLVPAASPHDASTKHRGFPGPAASNTTYRLGRQEKVFDVFFPCAREKCIICPVNLVIY